MWAQHERMFPLILLNLIYPVAWDTRVLDPCVLQFWAFLGVSPKHSICRGFISQDCILELAWVPASLSSARVRFLPGTLLWAGSVKWIAFSWHCQHGCILAFKISTVFVSPGNSWNDRGSHCPFYPTHDLMLFFPSLSFLPPRSVSVGVYLLGKPKAGLFSL